MKLPAAILLMPLLIGFSCTQTVAQDEVYESGTNAIRCRVNSAGPQISPKQANKLVIRLDNTFLVAKTITALTINLNEKPIPSARFHEPHAYYAPVDVELKSALIQKKDSGGKDKYPGRRMILPPHQTLEFPLDIAMLMWARNIPSELPAAEFFDVVQDGTYTVSVQLRTDEGAEVRCASIQLVVSRK